MPTFYLHHVLNRERVEDLEGLELDHLSAAVQEAVLNIREIQGYRLLAGEPLCDGHTEITDRWGRKLALIDFIDALRPA
jgi:hypothetical protein